MKQRKEDFSLVYLMIALIVFISFIPSLNNGFTNWDDDIYVTENWKIKSLNWYNIKHIFTTTHFGGYEPLTELMFALQYKFFKYNAKIYHLTNLVLHVINSLLVFYFIFLLTRKKEISFIVSLFFGIHPMHVESVAWISELKDVLFTLFLLISAINYVYYLENKNLKYYYISLITFIICLLPKAQALLFPFVLILIDYWFDKKINWDTLKNKAPFFIISFIFFMILYIGAKETRQIGSETLTSLFKNFLYANFALNFYIIRFFLPFNLSNCYPLPDKSGNLFFIILYYIGPFLTFIIALFLLIFRKNKIIIFSFFFYFINLLLVLQLKRINVTIVADRYTYVPYIGLLLLFTTYGYNFYLKFKDKRLINFLFLFIFISITFIFSFLTWQRCKVWKDSITLWSDTLKKYPNTPVAHNHYAVALQFEKKDKQNAVSHFIKAIELDPSYFAAYNNLGILYHDMKDYKKAIEIFNQGLKVNPTARQLYYNIGMAYHELGEIEKAIDYYKMAIKARKNYLGPYNNIARALMELKRFNEAEEYLKEALKYNPNYVYAYITFVDLMVEQGRYKDAFDYLNKAILIDPQSLLVRYKKAYLLNKVGDYYTAISTLEELEKVKPDDILILIEIARAYSGVKNFEKVSYYIKRVEAIDENHKELLKLKKEIKVF